MYFLCLMHKLKKLTLQVFYIIFYYKFIINNIHVKIKIDLMISFHDPADEGEKV